MSYHQASTYYWNLQRVHTHHISNIKNVSAYHWCLSMVLTHNIEFNISVLHVWTTHFFSSEWNRRNRPTLAYCTVNYTGVSPLHAFGNSGVCVYKPCSLASVNLGMAGMPSCLRLMWSEDDHFTLVFTSHYSIKMLGSCIVLQAYRVNHLV